MYGQSAKYNTMEHKFRGWRKQAENLRATAGEGTPQTQPQTTPRTPRTPTAGGRKPSTASKRKTSKATKITDITDTANSEAVEETSTAIVDISGDEDPIKLEIKRENAAVLSLMGIKSYGLSNIDDDDGDDDDDDDVQVLDEHASKRLKMELDLDDIPAKLPSFKSDHEIRIDSQANGYDLSLPATTVIRPDTNESALANLNTLVRGSGAYDPIFGNEA
jgi:hypothetical protein